MFGDGKRAQQTMVAWVALASYLGADTAERTIPRRTMERPANRRLCVIAHSAIEIAVTTPNHPAPPVRGNARRHGALSLVPIKDCIAALTRLPLGNCAAAFSVQGDVDRKQPARCGREQVVASVYSNVFERIPVTSD